MTFVPEVEVPGALLALPARGPVSLLALGGVAPSVLWAASRGQLRCPGASPLARFHQALVLGAVAVGASACEWAALRAVYPLPAAPHLPDDERARLADLHARFADGVVAALLRWPRPDPPEARAGFDSARALFVAHGARVRALAGVAEAQLDEGICDGATNAVDARRCRREAAYRRGVQFARAGADPRGARLRVEVRRGR